MATNLLLSEKLLGRHFLEKMWIDLSPKQWIIQQKLLRNVSVKVAVNPSVFGMKNLKRADKSGLEGVISGLAETLIIMHTVLLLHTKIKSGSPSNNLLI